MPLSSGIFLSCNSFSKDYWEVKPLKQKKEQQILVPVARELLKTKIEQNSSTLKVDVRRD